MGEISGFEGTRASFGLIDNVRHLSTKKAREVALDELRIVPGKSVVGFYGGNTHLWLVTAVNENDATIDLQRTDNSKRVKHNVNPKKVYMFLRRNV